MKTKLAILALTLVSVVLFTTGFSQANARNKLLVAEITRLRDDADANMRAEFKLSHMETYYYYMGARNNASEVLTVLGDYGISTAK